MGSDLSEFPSGNRLSKPVERPGVQREARKESLVNWDRRGRRIAAYCRKGLVEDAFRCKRKDPFGNLKGDTFPSPFNQRGSSMTRRLWTEPNAKLFWRELECCGKRPGSSRPTSHGSRQPAEFSGSQEPTDRSSSLSEIATSPLPASTFGD